MGCMGEGPCASPALSEQGHPNGLGNRSKDLKGKGTHHSQGQAGKGGTSPALPGSTDPAAIARPPAMRAHARQLTPTRGLALQSERCLQTPPPSLPTPLGGGCPAACLCPRCLPYLPGARAQGATPPWPWLRAQVGRCSLLPPGSPCFKNRPREVSFLHLPRPQPAPARGGGEEATRNWLFESAPRPIVPAPAPLPSLPPAPGRDGGGAVGLRSPSSVHPPCRRFAWGSCKGGRAKGLVPLSVHPCCGARRGDGVLGAMVRTGWAPPRLSRVMEPKHPPATAGAATGTI